LLFTELKTQNNGTTSGCVLGDLPHPVYTTRTDPWTYGRVIPVKPWCTGKQLPLGFNPCVLGSVNRIPR